jgi:hypothetical protein
MYLVYLGRRGGGIQLLIDTSLTLTRNKVSHTILLSSQTKAYETLLKSDHAEVKFYDIPHQFSDLFNLHSYPAYIFSVLKFLKVSWKPDHTTLVQIMPSPLDSIFDLLQSKKKFELVRCIHDYSPHPGETWPSSKRVHKMIKKADKVICFSDYVLQKVQKVNPNSCYLELPSDFYCVGEPSEFMSIEVERIKKDSSLSVLFLGRGIDYQGVNMLEGVIDGFPHLNFILAGEGEAIRNAQGDFLKFNYWISDADFIFLLQSVDIVIFPYIEASQSGTVPLARRARKFIVSSNAGGLPEQLDGYSRGAVYDSVSATDLHRALQHVIELCTYSNLDDIDLPPLDARSRRSLGDWLFEKKLNLTQGLQSPYRN